MVTDGNRCRLVVHVVEPLETGRDCDGLILLDPSISRRHLLVEPIDADAVVVSDLGSRNGTTVNGRTLPDHHRLRVGEVVRFGTCTLSLAPTAIARPTVINSRTAAATVVAIGVVQPPTDRSSADEPAAVEQIVRTMLARHNGTALDQSTALKLFGFDTATDAVAFAGSLLLAVAAHGAANPMLANNLRIGIDASADSTYEDFDRVRETAITIANQARPGTALVSATVFNAVRHHPTIEQRLTDTRRSTLAGVRVAPTLYRLSTDNL